MSDNPRLDAQGYPRVCGCCGQPTQLTSDIVVLVIFAPGLRKPYPLIPEHPYRVCNRAGCDSTWRFITRAAEAHSMTRSAAVDDWTRCVIVFSDGAGADIKNEVMELNQTPIFGGKPNGAKA